MNVEMKTADARADVSAVGIVLRVQVHHSGSAGGYFPSALPEWWTNYVVVKCFANGWHIRCTGPSKCVRYDLRLRVISPRSITTDVTPMMSIQSINDRGMTLNI